MLEMVQNSIFSDEMDHDLCFKVQYNSFMPETVFSRLNAAILFYLVFIHACYIE